MPSQISSTFAADFSPFTNAVASAEVKLSSLEAGGAKVEKMLTRVANAYSGRKTISEAQLATAAVEALGGRTALTDREATKLNATVAEGIAKYRALGQVAPASMLAAEQATRKSWSAIDTLKGSVGQIAAGFGLASLAERGVSALVGMGSEAIAFAGRIDDLSAKTKLGTETLQRMDYVATQTGGSLEGMAGAAYKLAVRIAGGDESVVKGLDALGLKLKDVQAMSRDEALTLINGRLEAIGDTTERTRVGTLLYSKSFGDMEAALEAGYSQIAANARVSSDAQIKALAAAGDAWDAFKSKMSEGVTSGLGNLVLGWEAYSQMSYEQYKKFLSLIAAKEWSDAREYLLQIGRGHRDVALAAEKATAAHVPYTQQLRDVNAETGKLTAAQRAEIDAGLKLGASVAELAENVGTTEGAIERYRDQHEKSDKSVKKHKDTTKDYGLTLREVSDELERNIALEREQSDSRDQLSGMRGLDEKWWGAGAGAALRADLEAQQAYTDAVLERATVTREHLAQLDADLAEESAKVWTALNETHRTVWDDMLDRQVGHVADMLSGLSSFKEAGIGIWRSMQSAVAEILEGMLSTYLTRFLGGMTAGTASASGGGGGGFLSSAVGGVQSSIFGGGGGSSGGGGTGGTGFGGFSLGKYGGGALVGGIAGLSAGLSSGSKTAGMLSGAMSGAMAGMNAGPWGIAIGAGVGAISGLVGGIIGGQQKARAEYKLIREQRDAFLKDRGGEVALSAYLGDAGSDELAAFMRANRAKGYDAASMALNREIGIADRAAAALAARQPLGTIEGRPYFDTGGRVPGQSHLDARLLGGEGVLSRRGMRTLDDLNDGKNPLGSGGAAAAIVTRLDRFMRDFPRANAQALANALVLAGRA